MTSQNMYGLPLVDLAQMLSNAASIPQQSIAASTSAMGSVFQAESGHGNIVGGIYSCLAVTAPPVYRMSLQGVSTRATPDGTIKASSNAYGTFTPSVGAAQVTFGSGYAPTIGDVLSLVIEYSSGTINGSHFATFAMSGNENEYGSSPYAMSETASVWSGSNGRPCVSPVYSDGYVGRRCCPASSFDNLSPNNASNPLYYASYFVPTLTMTISGAAVGMRPAVGSKFKVSLFEGSNTTPVAVSPVFDPDLLVYFSGPQGVIFLPMPSYTLTAGVIYRLALSFTTANTPTWFPVMSFSSQAAINAAWGPLYGSTSPSTISWTDYASGSSWRAYQVVPLIDSIACGGGLLSQRHFSGGIA